MFFLQLRQLMWKNFTIRKRSKFRLVTEIVWPVMLFAILAWVRTRGLKESNPACFLKERALPSAGLLQFLQSFFCTFSNDCYLKPPATFPAQQTVDPNLVNSVLWNLENVLLNRITDNDAESGSKVVADAVATAAYAFMAVDTQNIPQISLPLNQVVNQDALFQLVEQRNLSEKFLSSLLASQIELPSQNDLEKISGDFRQTLCNATALGSFVRASDIVLEQTSYLLCSSSVNQILGIVNNTALLNQSLSVMETAIGQQLHPDDWIKMGRLLRTIVNDVRQLESLRQIVRELSDTSVGKFALVLTQNAWDASNSTDIGTIFNTTSRMICGDDVENIAHVSRAIRARRGSFRRRFQKANSKNAKNSKVANATDDRPLSAQCSLLFNTLYQNNRTRLVFELLYPFVRGKLVYSPNVPAFDGIIEDINVSFQALRNVSRAAEMWLNDISPRVHDVLNRMNSSALLEGLQSLNISLPFSASGTISADDLVDQIETINSTLYQLDTLAHLAMTYIDCYEFDKFEGYPTEAQATKRGIELMQTDNLWAVIAFQHDDLPANATVLPPHIKYKIRMDSYKIDSTKRIRDEFKTPIPRNSPLEDLKYFTSGFIYLQDLIEQAVIRKQTGRQQLPGVYLQQFPSPCYVYDTYFMALAQLFPLFMVLSFVYTASMTVKSVVHEKERRLKETMRTMGLGNAVHWVAWFIDSISSMIAACILLSFILVRGQVLEKSDPLLVFVFVISFSIATICQSFLVSTFFSKANLAAACGAFIFFICFLPYNVLEISGRSYKLKYNVLLSLLSNVAFGIGCSYFANYEQAATGAQWTNWTTSPIEEDEFNLCGAILMMLADSVIYLALTWYIETVFPGEFGVPKPFYFMFQPSYWCPKRKKQKTVKQNPLKETDFVEEESTGMRIGVSIRNLGKTYSNGKEALRNLSLDFYEDQITAFLGHNGAGKTTTISILTGLYTPSSGTATINGLDIGNKMDDIRQQLGLCPQYNVLFDELTVEEHLLFYANLKSGERVESRKEIDQMIDDLGLSHKRNSLSVHLSGGMKRKLSIGAAFIGGSKTVILDEPTAGVDPYSRRSIWDILLKYKTGRTIILTTHFMDEADMLGDRIAIIAQGQLKCCGSSLFLKRRIGSGYYLTLVRTDPNEASDTASFVSDSSGAVPLLSTSKGSEAIGAIVQRHIPNAVPIRNVGSDFVFCLPDVDNEGHQQRERFPNLFDELDESMHRHGFTSYGVSDTTLEEIFLKVANDPSESSNSEERGQLSASIKLRAVSALNHEGRQSCRYSEVSQRPDEEVSSSSLRPTERVTGIRLILQQLAALYVKRFHNSRRSVKGFFGEVVLPALSIIINLLVTMQFKPTQPEPALNLNPWLYGPSGTTFFTQHNASLLWPDEYQSQLLNGSGMGVRCMAGNPLGLPCDDDPGLQNPRARPDDYEDLLCPCTDGFAQCPANSSSGEFYRYNSPTTDTFYDLASKSVPLWIVQSEKALGNYRFGGFEFGVNNPLSNINFTQLAQGLTGLARAARLEENFQLNTTGRIVALGNESVSLGVLDGVRVWFNNKAWASSVSYLNAINNVILRSSLPHAADPLKYGIEAFNHPMNYTSDQLQDMITRQIGLSVMNAIGVIFSMSFVPASFVLFLVEERSSKTKHLQLISGVKPITFWFATFTWDMLNYAFPAFLIVMIFVAFDTQAFISEENLPGTVILLFIYGLSAIPLMYPASLIFEIPSSAFVSLSCINLFVGMVATLSSFVLELFDDEELKFIGSIISQVFLIFPHYCLGRGLIDLAKVHYTAVQLETMGIVYAPYIFKWSILGRYIVSMIIQAVIFFVFNLMLHHQALPACFQLGFLRKLIFQMDPDDEDVARERLRVENDTTKSDSLLLSQLTKVYNGAKRPAVNRLSFGVRRGECFGLLGVNGAGKSTTFKMLTGDEAVTHGNAWVGGQSVLTELEKARRNLGYCPQEDALLPRLTGVEHLQLFARLRGIRPQDIDQVVSESLRKLSLVPYKDRCAGTYSGGNKRKLSTAVSLIGNPTVVFLDEPSSGMDPGARRSLWDAVLKAVRDSQSVLLTSHSMEECQVLCTRLAIMVNGTLKCLGSPQHLKNRFGNGYMINVRCKKDSVEQVLEQVRAVLPEGRLRERRHCQLVWHVQPGALSVAAMFIRMEAARSASEMVDYSISQTTLDDVFIRFASQQRDDNDDTIVETDESLWQNEHPTKSDFSAKL